jgi:hypothetical protein
MRLKPQEVVGEVNLNEPFLSSLPSLPDLEESFLSPLTTQLLNPSNPQWGQDLSNDALRLMRDIAGRSATQIGVQSNYIPDLNQITSAILSENYLDLAEGLVVSGMDIAFSAMGAVPFVGPLAEAAAKFVFLIVDLAQAKEVRPPQSLTRYNKVENQEIADAVLDQVGGPADPYPDWTPIFRPVAIGPWKRQQTHDGYQFEVDLDSDLTTPLGGYGVIPNSLQGLDQLQVSDFGIRSANWSGAGGFDIIVRDITEMSPQELAVWIQVAAWDAWDVRYSGIRAAAACWQACKTRTAAMFNIDTRKIADQWRAYVSNGLELTNKYEKSTAKSRKLEQAQLDRTTAFAASTLFYDLEDPMQVNDLPKNRRLDVLAGYAVNDLRTRQLAAIKTRLVAYCSENQVAFRNKNFRNMLIERRKQLLTHKEVANIVLEDVIDDDYRSEVMRAQLRGPGRFTAAPSSGQTVRSDWNEDSIPVPEGWNFTPKGVGGFLGLNRAWPYVAGGLAVAGGSVLAYRYWDEIGSKLSRVYRGARKRLPGGRR